MQEKKRKRYNEMETERKEERGEMRSGRREINQKKKWQKTRHTEMQKCIQKA